MSRKCHQWRKGHELPTIRPHSLAKHRVLRAYLERYVSVLTANPRQKQLKLTLVDGFAGGGKYLELGSREERPGSPIIMLEAMKAAESAARASRRSNEFTLDVEYFFIEKTQDAFAHLKSVIQESEYRALIDNRIHLINSEFVPEVPKIIEFVKTRNPSGRAIWVVDQCGYLDAPLPTIAMILRELPNAEVILTMATDFLIAYLNETDETQARIKQLGIDLPSAKIRDAKVEREWRRLIQFFLHQEIPEKTGLRPRLLVGATFRTPTCPRRHGRAALGIAHQLCPLRPFRSQNVGI
jgi:three-Cys-motif partner protein